MQLDNIVQLNIIGIIIMFSLVFNLSYLKQSSLPRRYFNIMFITVFSMLTIDTLLFLSVNYIESKLNVLKYLGTTLVQFSYIIPVVMWLSIVLSDLDVSDRTKTMIKRLMIICFSIVLGFIVTNPFTSLLFVFNSDGQSSLGKLFFLHPLFSILLGAIGISILIKKGKIKTNVNHLNYLIAIIIMGLGGIIQSIPPQYSTYWMATAIALIFIYSAVLGDTSKVDEKTGLYNYRYHKSIIADYKEYGIPYVLMQFTPFEGEHLDTKSFENFAKKITDTYYDLGIFTSNSSNAIVLLSKSTSIKSLTRIIQDRRENQEDFLYGILEVNK